MKEEWRPIPGYDGYYEVSDLGSVRSLKRTVSASRRGTPYRRGVCARTLRTPLREGYPSVDLCIGGKRKTFAVHQLLCLAFIGPPPPGMVVRHINGKHRQTVLTNLTYGTPKQNSEDMIRHGRSGKGERNPNAKIDEATVAAMKALRGMVPNRWLASVVGVAHETVRDIQARRWPHVPAAHNEVYDRIIQQFQEGKRMTVTGRVGR